MYTSSPNTEVMIFLSSFREFASIAISISDDTALKPTLPTGRIILSGHLECIFVMTSSTIFSAVWTITGVHFSLNKLPPIRDVFCNYNLWVVRFFIFLKINKDNP